MDLPRAWTDSGQALLKPRKNPDLIKQVQKSLRSRPWLARNGARVNFESELHGVTCAIFSPLTIPEVCAGTHPINKNFFSVSGTHCSPRDLILRLMTAFRRSISAFTSGPVFNFWKSPHLNIGIFIARNLNPWGLTTADTPLKAL